MIKLGKIEIYLILFIFYYYKHWLQMYSYKNDVYAAMPCLLYLNNNFLNDLENLWLFFDDNWEGLHDSLVVDLDDETIDRVGGVGVCSLDTVWLDDGE